jgi:hypothetical protein
MKKSLRFFILMVLMVSFQTGVIAQKRDSAYVQTISNRAWKIVEKLNIDDQQKAYAVRDVIANQYMNLNDIYIKRDADLKELKSNKDLSKIKKDKEVKQIQDFTQTRLTRLHKKYVNQLHKNLTSEQVIQVKDGMTYGVVPLTYNAYQEMLPNLTQKQKEQIYLWLVEAREYAMDAESSEKKHAWFGKYKGKVNNYLSAEGIDMKKAGEEWQERIKKQKRQ